MLRTGISCLGLRRYLSTQTPNEVFFSGIQPTGVPHIGNYFGFIKLWIKHQNANPKGEKILAVVDLHAITTALPNASIMRDNIVKMTASLLACGVDPAKTILFQQSQVPEHTELSWILGSLQTITQLQRLPQYKDKSKKYNKGQVPLGLVSYPVLQSADVLLYRGTHVPVGEDQSQHMNLLADVAHVFNLRYKVEHFPIPKMVTSPVPRIKSLRNPNQKMSKSDINVSSRIDVDDTADQVQAKIRRALSDTNPAITYDWETRPGVSNLISIYSAFTDKTPDEIVKEAQNLDTLAFKNALIDTANAHLSPIRDRYQKLSADEGYIWQVLTEGSEKARAIAVDNLNKVKEIVGFK